MKIAVIAKTRLPVAEPFRGGLEAFTHSLCQQYLEMGHKITLYAHSESDPSLSLTGFYGADFRDSPYFEIYENDEYLSILKDIDRRQFDIVHNNSTHELPILWGINSSIPVVTTIHTPPITKLKAAISIASGSRNLHYVFPSVSFKKQWDPYVDSQYRVIHNGVDLKKWSSIREGKEYIFWYGRIVHAKGLDIVIDAAVELNIPLKFAGSIDDVEYYKSHIEPRLSEKVEYLGHLRQEALHQQMKYAAVVVSAVRWEEPFGLTNVEAMASGVPVAGFDRGAFSELVDHKSGIVAEYSNVHYLVSAIQSAISLKTEDVCKRAEKFSLKKMTENYINFFEELI